MNKLSLEPQSVNEDTWYYEERKGVLVVHRLKDKNGDYEKTVQILLPWKKLLNSCERKYG